MTDHIPDLKQMVTDRERNHVPELEHIIQTDELPLHVIVAPIAGELPWMYITRKPNVIDCSGWEGFHDETRARYAIEGWLAEKVWGAGCYVAPEKGKWNVWTLDTDERVLRTGCDTPLHALVAAYLKMGAE